MTPTTAQRPLGSLDGKRFSQCLDTLSRRDHVRWPQLATLRTEPFRIDHHQFSPDPLNNVECFGLGNVGLGRNARNAERMVANQIEDCDRVGHFRRACGDPSRAARRRSSRLALSSEPSRACASRPEGVERPHSGRRSHAQSYDERFNIEHPNMFVIEDVEDHKRRDVWNVSYGYQTSVETMCPPDAGSRASNHVAPSTNSSQRAASLWSWNSASFAHAPPSPSSCQLKGSSELEAQRR